MKPPKKPTIEIDVDRDAVLLGGREIFMPPKERKILSALMDRKTKTREELCEVAGIKDECFRSVDQHVYRIRRKLPKGTIRTITGRGYRFDL